MPSRSVKVTGRARMTSGESSIVIYVSVSYTYVTTSTSQSLDWSPLRRPTQKRIGQGAFTMEQTRASVAIDYHIRSFCLVSRIYMTSNGLTDRKFVADPTWARANDLLD